MTGALVVLAAIHLLIGAWLASSELFTLRPDGPLTRNEVLGFFRTWTMWPVDMLRG